MPVTPPPRIRLDDDRITQRQAAKLLAVTFPTISRYMTKGRKGIRLPSVPYGGRRWTTREAIDWWLLQIQSQDQGGIDPSGPYVDDIDIDAELAAEGI